MEKPQIMLHIGKSVNYTIYDSKWIPSSAKLVALGNHPRGTGALQIFEMNVNEGDIKLTKDIEKGKGFKCGTFAGSNMQERYLATGDIEGKMQMWNLESLESPVYSVNGHKEIINCIDGVGGLGIGEGAPELVTGSRDGAVKVWDPRQKHKAVVTMEPSEGETKRDCWAVAFGHAHNSHDRCVASGYDNGDIKLFDLRSMALRWETNVKNGVCGLEFDRKDINMNKLVVTSLESSIQVFDMRTHHPTKGYSYLTEKAHKSTVWFARHLPQNRDVFMTGGGNGSVNLWKYNYPSQRCMKDSNGEDVGVTGTLSLLQNTTLSTQPIASFDWCRDMKGLGLCTSFDQCLRVVIVTKLNTL